MSFMSLSSNVSKGLALCVAAFAVGACGLDFTHEEIPYAKNKSERVYERTTKHGTIFGPDGMNSLFGGSNQTPEGGGAGLAVPVNSYLWRATLDTLSFMPLASADPFGGVVITDWYAPPGGDSERFKMTVYILSRELRADGLRVGLFRQTQGPNGDWVEAEVDGSTPVELENAILTRAREMRIAGVVE